MEQGLQQRSRQTRCARPFSTSCCRVTFAKNIVKLYVQEEGHRLWYCGTFKGMMTRERCDIVKSNNSCENCLTANHTAEDCKRLSVCSVPGCGKKHSRDLHASGNTTKAEVSLPIVPDRVNGFYRRYALLDPSSTDSFCSKRLTNKLNLKSASNLSTLSQPDENVNTRSVNFNLDTKGRHGELPMSDVYVVDENPVDVTPIDKRKYAHLKNVPELKHTVTVEILVGQDNVEALIPLEVRTGKWGEAFASPTLLAWTVNGPVGNVTKKKDTSHFIATNSPTRYDFERTEFFYGG